MLPSGGLTCNGNALAKELVAWKKAVAARWDEIEVVQVETNEGLNARIEAGKEYDVTVVLDEKGLDDVGSFKLAFRMYPKNGHLPHRQDFCYVRWL